MLHIWLEKGMCVDYVKVLINRSRYPSFECDFVFYMYLVLEVIGMYFGGLDNMLLCCMWG